MEASGQAYAEALSELYPTRADVAAEIAELEGRLCAAASSTELFASDIHGEYSCLLPCAARADQARCALLVEDVFGSTLNDDEQAGAARTRAAIRAEHCAYALEHVEDADAWLRRSRRAPAPRFAPVGPPATAPSTRCARFSLDDLAIAEGVRRRAQHAGPAALSARRSSKVSSPPARARPCWRRWARSSSTSVVDQLHLSRRRVRPRARRPSSLTGRAPFLAPTSMCSGATTTSCGWAPPPAARAAWPTSCASAPATATCPFWRTLLDRHQPASLGHLRRRRYARTTPAPPSP